MIDDTIGAMFESFFRDLDDSHAELRRLMEVEEAQQDLAYLQHLGAVCGHLLNLYGFAVAMPVGEQTLGTIQNAGHKIVLLALTTAKRADVLKQRLADAEQERSAEQRERAGTTLH